MSIIKPINRAVTQDFDGAYYKEKPGYIQTNLAVKRGKRQPFAGGRYQKALHLAIDYGAAVGTPVYAVQAGKVLGCGTDSTGGVFIYLRVKTSVLNQIVAFYYHLSALKVKVGDDVVQGQVIALSGNTGGVTVGAGHLHFTLMRGPRIRSMSWFYSYAMRYDPQPFIDGRALATII